jgi:hypothetical protein
MKTRYGFFVLVFFLCFLTVSKASAEIIIKAEVDKTSITAEEIITYKLTVSSSEKDLPEPELAKFPGFNIVSSLRSSNISFSQGSMRAVMAYSFVLAPAAEGRFKIGPSHIDFKNKRYESESFEIDVKKSSKPVTPGAKPKKPNTEELQGQQKPPEYTL